MILSLTFESSESSSLCPDRRLSLILTHSDIFKFHLTLKIRYRALCFRSDVKFHTQWMQGTERSHPKADTEQAGRSSWVIWMEEIVNTYKQCRSNRSLGGKNRGFNMLNMNDTTIWQMMVGIWCDWGMRDWWAGGCGEWGYCSTQRGLDCESGLSVETTNWRAGQVLAEKAQFSL